MAKTYAIRSALLSVALNVFFLWLLSEGVRWHL